MPGLTFPPAPYMYKNIVYSWSYQNILIIATYYLLAMNSIAPS